MDSRLEHISPAAIDHMPAFDQPGITGLDPCALDVPAGHPDCELVRLFREWIDAEQALERAYAAHEDAVDALWAAAPEIPEVIRIPGEAKSEMTEQHIENLLRHETFFYGEEWAKSRHAQRLAALEEYTAQRKKLRVQFRIEETGKDMEAADLDEVRARERLLAEPARTAIGLALKVIVGLRFDPPMLERAFDPENIGVTPRAFVQVFRDAQMILQGYSTVSPLPPHPGTVPPRVEH